MVASLTESRLPKLEDVRIKFASIGLMRSLLADKDPTICVTSHSICALLARHILHKYPPRDSGLAWLQDVLGQPSNTIYNALENLGTVDMTRLFMASFHIRRATFRLRRPSFVDTLAVLMRTGSETAIHRGAFEGGLSEFLRRAEIEDHLREVPDKLCRISEVISPTGLESLTSHK